MTLFPAPLPLPPHISQQRMARKQELTFALLISVGIRLGIVLAELLGHHFFGSSTLFAEAVSTGIDLLSSLLLMGCVYLADRDPDANHPFGHGKYEPLGGMLLGVGIVALGISLALCQSPSSEPLGPALFLIPLFSSFLLEGGYRFLMSVGRKQNSSALKADAWHFRIDGISSLIATTALIFSSFFPESASYLDHLGALLIALFMAAIGLQAIYENLHQILDGRPEESYFDQVRKAAMEVPGVMATEKLLIQAYGPDAHIAIDIEVDPALSVDVSHRITQKVRRKIQHAWPAVRDVVVHVEPHYPEDPSSILSESCNKDNENPCIGLRKERRA